MNTVLQKSLILVASFLILGAGCSLPWNRDLQPLDYNTKTDILLEPLDAYQLQGNALVYTPKDGDTKVLFSDLRDEIKNIFPSWDEEEIFVEFFAQPKDEDRIFFGIRYLYTQKIWEMNKNTYDLRETDISWSNAIISPSGKFLARLKTEYQIEVINLVTEKKILFEMLPKGFSYAQTYSGLDSSPIDIMSWSEIKPDVILAEVFLDTPKPLSNAFVERKSIATIQYFVDSN